jgi:hypothetical protein
MSVNGLPCLALVGAVLCSGCSGPATYQLENIDSDSFRHDYAECTRLQVGYVFTYERNPLDPITPFEKCMRDRGYALSRPQ